MKKQTIALLMMAAALGFTAPAMAADKTAAKPAKAVTAEKAAKPAKKAGKKNCDPKKSKPCGKGCIPLKNECHK